MRKKRNILKRNSGFIVGCVIAAGASFFTANMMMTDMITLPVSESDTPEAVSEAVLAPEKTVTRTYETDAFTVTASGNVIKGVEEVQQTVQADENGEAISVGETNTENASSETDSAIGSADSSGASDGGYQDGDYWEQNGSSDNSSSSSSSSSENGGYSDNSWSDNGSYDQNIQIQNPGNGDYTYSDNSNGNWGGTSNSGNTGSSNSSGNSSSSSEPAWTPDDVIIRGISSRYIDVSELYPYGLSKLRLIRNEIFALHGRIFKSQDLMDYFCQKAWYVPTYNPQDFDANMFYYLNDYEEANLQTILDYEAWYAENYRG